MEHEKTFAWLSRFCLAGLAEQLEELRRHRDNLNNHVHSPLVPAGVTAYQAIGELVRLAAAGVEPAPFRLENPLTWAKDQFKAKHQMARDAAAQLAKFGNPRLHPWRGVQLAAALPAGSNDQAGLWRPLPMIRLRYANRHADRRSASGEEQRRRYLILSLLQAEECRSSTMRPELVRIQ